MPVPTMVNATSATATDEVIVTLRAGLSTATLAPPTKLSMLPPPPWAGSMMVTAVMEVKVFVLVDVAPAPGQRWVAGGPCQ